MVRRQAAEHRRAGPAALGFHLLLGPIFAEMGKNMARNLAENRVALAEILCRKR